MKNYLKTCLIAVLISSAAFAQPKDHKMNKMKVESMRIGFITEQLSLTPTEAEKFWPVFHEMNDQLSANDEKMRAARDEMSQEGIDEKKLEALMADKFEMDMKNLMIKKKYHDQYIKILGAHKVAKLYKSEHEFKRTLLRELKDQGRAEKMEHREDQMKDRKDKREEMRR